MKRKVLYRSSRNIAALVSLLGLPYFVQAQELKAQAYIMTEYIVKPYMTKAFEAATAEEKAMFAAINYAFGWTAFSTEDFHYYFFVPIGKDATSLDKHNAALDEAEARLPENYAALEKKMAEASEYWREAVVYLRPDLSFTPAESRIKDEDSNYVFFEFAYILPDKEKEFEAFYKDWAALCRKIGFRIGYVAYRGIFGTDNPLYISTMIAKTQADTFVEEDRLMKTLGPDVQAELGTMYEKAYTHFRKYETRHGRSRPDLSYVPKLK